MKVTIDLNRDEFDMALNSGALKALSTAMRESAPANNTAPINEPVQAVDPVKPASAPRAAAPIPIPVQAQPVQNTIPVQTQMPTAVPTTTQSYTMEQLAVAATQLVDAGRRNELVGLLQAFGVQALTALPKEQYGAFATQLRAMGAKI